MGYGRGKSAGTKLREVEDVLAGMILLWSGAIVDIPAGYVLCDGNNGTPDLTDRFIIGAGNTYNPDASGGGVNHNHTFTGDGHTHLMGAGSGVNAGIGWSTVTSSGNATGTTDNGGTLPPYYALAYIMKT